MDGGNDVAAEIRAILAEHERYMRAMIASATGTTRPETADHHGPSGHAVVSVSKPPQILTPPDAPFALLRRAAM
jgi:hypothetical protein